ncbi:MAG: hypothetical protein C0193_00915 [Candidatus Bathyarchaeota archaeon]|nr:MAG: hypothetical protein C0193_00915 [Candidatus Bathyarchaeota archaeon]
MTEAFKKFFLDSRAITPVLSNLLLTVVAVGAMAIATTATYVITTNMREIMSERIIVEDLWFNNSTGNIQVYLRNVGKVAIHVSAVYINHTSQPFTPHPFSLEIGEHDWLNISYAWMPNSLYYIDIVTTRGTHIAEYYKTP